jgi:hypothetical protein
MRSEAGSLIVRISKNRLIAHREGTDEGSLNSGGMQQTHIGRTRRRLARRRQAPSNPVRVKQL